MFNWHWRVQLAVWVVWALIVMGIGLLFTPGVLFVEALIILGATTLLYFLIIFLLADLTNI